MVDEQITALWTCGGDIQWSLEFIKNNFILYKALMMRKFNDTAEESDESIKAKQPEHFEI